MGATKTQVIDSAELKTENESTDSTSKKAREPKVRGKKYKAARAKVDKSKLYSLKDAVALAKETATAKFDGTLELHLLMRKADVSAQVELPNSTGKSKKVEIADETTIEKLKEGKIDFDVLLTTADMMPKLVPFARILGPRGLMPNPKNGTIIASAKDAEKFNADKMTVKTEKKAPVIHTVVGKVSMDDKKVIQNIEAVFKAVNKKQAVKAYITSTMGPSVKIDLS
jgi:large subunit ribosomal protein L1